MFLSKISNVVRRAVCPRYVWLSLTVSLILILLLSAGTGPTVVNAVCWTATSAECNILNDKAGCVLLGKDFGTTTDVYTIVPTQASGNTFDPSGVGGTCGWGGIAVPSCSDTNVTLSVVGGVSSKSLVQATVPAGYLSGGGSFKVFYNAFAYVGTLGTAEKFVGGCFKVIPANYPTSSCPASEDIACGFCH
jgi:hypothetical protein